MKPESKNRLFSVGVMVALGLVVMGLAIIGITSRQGMFERKVDFYSSFPDAAGLKEGSSVWFQGVEVGYITKLEFSGDTDNAKIKISYKVSSKLLPRINGNTRAAIRSLGLLGDKYVSLESIEGEVKNPTNLIPGSEIKYYEPISLRELGHGAQDVMATVNDLSKNLNTLIVRIQRGGGPVSRILGDPKLGDELVLHSRSILAALDKVANGLLKGEGLAGGLLAKNGEGDESARKLRESIDSFSSIIKGIEEGRGAMGLLITEADEGKDSRKALEDLFSSLSKVSKSLEDPDSMLHKLMVDEKYGKEFSEHLLSMSRSLDSILLKIDKGEGSLGALINDPDVYNSLALSAKGMQKSGVVKWYLEKKAKEAAQDEKKNEERREK